MKRLIVLYMVCSIMLLHLISGNYIFQDNNLYKNNALSYSADENESNLQITKQDEAMIEAFISGYLKSKDETVIGLIKRIIQAVNGTRIVGNGTQTGNSTHGGGGHSNGTHLLSNECMVSLGDMFSDGLKLLVAGKYTEFMMWLKNEKTLLYYIDAWGKMPTSILHGDAFWYGGYKECQGIDGAHYCLADMVLLSAVRPINGAFGTCVPKGCSGDDVYNILHTTKALKQVVDFPANGPFKQTYGSAVLCDDNKEYPTDTIILIAVIALLFAMVVLGTIIEGLSDTEQPKKVLLPVSKTNGSYEVAADDKGGAIANGSAEKEVVAEPAKESNSVFRAFSLYKNVPVLLSTTQPRGGITSINGIRAISITWVILGHVFYYGVSNKPENPVSVFGIMETFSFQVINNATTSVDSFFLLSGLLVAYLSLKKMDKAKGRLNLQLFYLHRILRLTPSYMLLLWVSSSLLPEIIDSPMGILDKTRAEDLCKDTWWANLLYIQNIYPGWEKMCFGWSWYLANDMQFYVVSPLFLYIFYKYKLKGANISTGVTLILCATISAIISGYYKLPSILTSIWKSGSRSSYDDGMIFANQIYIKPYTRIGPYIIGMLLGYLLKEKIDIFKRGNKLKKALLGWTCATVVGMLVIYGPYDAYRKNGKPFTPFEDAFYNSFARIGWGFALAWVIYACHYGAGGIINTFLSWGGWVPLSRLTFGAYLWHPMILAYYYRGSEKPYHYQVSAVVYIFVATLGLAYGLAFLTAVLVDVPVTNLEQMLLKKLLPPRKPEKNKESEMNGNTIHMEERNNGVTCVSVKQKDENEV